ncbi:MAG: hypothetical protein ND807_11015 [Vicinamibacterales bacterium]|nr:hypothetical protein [Vicinamibacterales bacterium]
MALRRAFAVLGAVALMMAMPVPSFGQDYPPPQDPRPDPRMDPNQGQPQRQGQNQNQSQGQERRKLSKDELASYDAMNVLVNSVIAGKTPAPADVKLTFRNHYLKSNNNLYVPYSVDVEPGKLTTAPVVMYIRVISKDPTAAAAAAAKAKANARGGDASYAFEDVYFLAQPPTQVDRAMELPAGDYDVYVAMAERPKDKKAQATAKSVVLTHTLNVPSTGTALTTSAVILAKGIEQAAGALTAQQQLEQPYTISGYKITPRFSAAIPKAEELVFVFFIYNEGVTPAGKPDLDVDYMFYRAAEDKPFSKLATTSFNATTLPGEFDIAKGHQVFVGQGIPLTTFTPGDYKLEIKITDKTNSSTATRNMPFSVTP